MRLYEATTFGSERVDRNAGIIYGVKILGRESKNGRTYSSAAMEQAARLYDKKDVNLNHPSRSTPNAERKIEDALGWFESVNVRPDGVFGNLHYLKEHPSAGIVAEAAERNSRRFGFSHNASGSVVKKNGKNVVESVERVLSIDLVQSPATCDGLFESQQQTIREVLQQHAPEVLAQLLEDGALLPPEVMDEPMPIAGAQEDATATVKAAMGQILTAMLDLPGDLRAMCVQLVPVFQKIIAGQPDPAAQVDPNDPNADPNADPNNPDPQADPASGEQPADGSTMNTPAAGDQNAADPEAEGSADDNPFKKKRDDMPESTLSNKDRQELETLREENKRLHEQLDHKALREQCEVLLKKNHRESSDALLTALANMPTEEARLQLIEELPSIKPVEERPRKPNFFSPPAGKRDEGAYPSDVKSFVEACR